MRRLALFTLALLALGAGTDWAHRIGTANIIGNSSGVIYESLWIPADLIYPDADGGPNQCVRNAQAQVNSGPIWTTLTCDDSSSATMWFDFELPQGYNGGAIFVKPVSYSINATPSGSWAANYGCAARQDATVINATIGSTINVSTAYSTQYNIEIATTATGATPNGVVGTGVVQHLYCKVNTLITSDALMTDVRIRGVMVEIPRNALTD